MHLIRGVPYLINIRTVICAISLNITVIESIKIIYPQHVNLEFNFKIFPIGTIVTLIPHFILLAQLVVCDVILTTTTNVLPLNVDQP